MDVQRDTYAANAMARAVAGEDDLLFSVVDCALGLYDPNHDGCLDYDALVAAVIAAVPGLPANACLLETGTYTGDGALAQIINLADPLLDILGCLVRPVRTSETFCEVFYKSKFTGSDYASVHRNVAGASHVTLDNRLIAIAIGAFTVDDDAANLDPNAAGQLYEYIVWGIRA